MKPLWIDVIKVDAVLCDYAVLRECLCANSQFYCESVFSVALINSAVPLADVRPTAIKAGSIIFSLVFETDSVFDNYHE